MHPEGAEIPEAKPRERSFDQRAAIGVTIFSGLAGLVAAVSAFFPQDLQLFRGEAHHLFIVLIAGASITASVKCLLIRDKFHDVYLGALLVCFVLALGVLADGEQSSPLPVAAPLIILCLVVAFNAWRVFRKADVRRRHGSA
ncbi:MAG: hypothetical protein ACK4K7_15705 [Allosphingosinicella sp.]|uniref:hypothetical protein n=1 Tax=Allosphingosinicella sp. TaxID=2823234 RepID=UPI0039468332